MASRPIYQFYAELDHYKPKIWRRFQVASYISVARFGYIVQVLFEMTASKLMTIEVPPVLDKLFIERERTPELICSSFFDTDDEDLNICRYEIFDESCVELLDDSPDIHFKDAAKTRLRNAMNIPGDKAEVGYDSNWYVIVTLEKIFTDKDLPVRSLPRVLEGAGFGIVEAVSGTEELNKLVNAFQRKEGTDYKRYSELVCDKDFDLSAFDLDDMNYRLKKIPLIYQRWYEDRIRPTPESDNLIERKYLKRRDAS